MFGGDRVVGRALANLYRRDRDPELVLFRGRVGFEIALAGLPEHSFFLGVREVGGGSVPGSPRLMTAAGFGAGVLPLEVVEIDGAPVGRLPGDMVLWRGLAEGCNRLVVPAGVVMVVLSVRRRNAPGDARRLGVPVRGVAVDGVAVDLGSPGLALGFYGIEAGADGARWRWSADLALLDLGPSDRVRVLTVDAGAPEGAPVRVGMGFSLRLISAPGGAHVGGRLLSGLG